MIETPTPHLIPWLDGPLRPKAQVIYDAFPEWKKRSIFADNPGDTTMNADDFLKKLSVAGGEIVSTGSLTSAEIATAFNDGRMYVDQDHMGYVFLPACPELKPDPDQRIEAVEKLCHRYDPHPHEREPMNHEQIARVAHEVNRAYCQSLGDMSLLAWEDAPEWQKAGVRMGVDLHTSGDFGPETSHSSWMKHKIDEGWVYGEVKDPGAKTHPCLVPFDQLPREQQAKDFIFRATVHALR